ncbi:MAG: AEC family transporter [Treponema sp.]|nr:AEC family transporter [Treponema sp.]
MFLLVLKQLSIMLLIGICGFVFGKIFKCGDSEQKFLSKLLLYFINPCMVFNTFNRDFDSARLLRFLFVIAIALVLHFVMIGISFFASKSRDSSQEDYKQIDRVAMVFTNCGFIGIPLINGVFGDEGVFYLMGYLVVFNLLLWTYGYYQMGGKMNLKKIITNPNVIAVILGITLFCLPFKLPELIQKPLSMIAETNTAMAMILIGLLFSNFKLPKNSEIAPKNSVVESVESPKSIFLHRVIRAILVRLVLMSIINFGVIIALYKIFAFMPDIRLIVFVSYICSMCPTATSVPSLACVFDKDASYASILVPLTSLGCILTIPAFVALAELVIK